VATTIDGTPGAAAAATDLDRSPARSRRRYLAAVVAVLVLAAVVRAVSLGSGLPYSSYIDEGHFLHPTEHMLANDTWRAGTYQNPYEHPSLLYDAIAIAAEGYRVVGGSDIKSGAVSSDRSAYYDDLEPASLILIGRLVVLAFSLGTVVVTILLARRLLGRSGGLVAGVIAALTPALVSRSAIVIVDTPATFFVALTLLLVAMLDASRRGLRLAVLAGAAAGLAFTSKYTSGAAMVSVFVGIALVPGLRWTAKAGRAAAATGAAAVAAVLTMPALVFSFSQVHADVVYESHVYSRYDVGHYWTQLVRNAEVGWVLAAVSVAGVVVLGLAPRSRRVTLAWLGYTVSLGAYLFAQQYQPVRNLLPCVPFLAIGAAASVLAAARAIARMGGLSARARTGLVVGATTALALVLLISGVVPYIRDHAGVVDTRTSAVDWLVDRVHPGQRVLVAAELAVLPSELRRLERAGARVVVRPAVAPGSARPSGFDYVVTGRFGHSLYFAAPIAWAPVDGRRPSGQWGSHSVQTAPNFWRSNSQAVLIYRG
jgi:4-amino-4-deoxy-L-arabinose transferase-like glycosyltransferase